MTDVTPWTRLQDWVSLIAGGILGLAPIWVSVDNTVAWAMSVTGAAIAVLAVVALAVPGSIVDEWITAAAGVVAFVLPWVFTFTGDTAAAWTSWVTGAIVAIAALSAVVPSSREVYRAHHHVG